MKFVTKFIRVILLLLIMILLFNGCRFVKGSYGYSDAVEVTTEYGDIFNIAKSISTFPDYDVVIGVSMNNEHIFTGFYGSDFSDEYWKVTNDFSVGLVRAYEFCWGLLYSVDNGQSFFGVSKNSFDKQYLKDDDFKYVYNTLYNIGSNATAENGTEFTVSRYESVSAEPYLSMSIFCTGEVIFTSTIKNESQYDYQNDLVDNFHIIIREYHSDEFEAYEFNWCILYSFDGAKGYSGVLKEDYNKAYLKDASFKTVYDNLKK